ncbi:MAG: DNA polymerase III subunit delta' [Marinagarivorans sp.]|nr:DNA polymerase III subunit delta' [Marinagarivorans sp.]
MSNALLLAQPPFPWFSTIWQQLTEQVRVNRLPHALLFKGTDGIGAAELAAAFAQFLLCRSPLESRACGRCRGCELLIAGTHPDFILVAPEEGSSVIKIAQIRELAQRVANTAQQGGRKVIVLTPTEAMNIEASNALLKNLEEPSGDTVFILVSYQIARVLPTIRSRTSQLALVAPTYPQALDWLNDHSLPNAEALLTAAGGPVKALQWSQSGLMAVFNEADHCLNDVIKGDLSPIDGAKKMASYDLVVFFGFVQHWLQASIRHNFNAQFVTGQSAQAFTAYPMAARFTLLDAVQTRLAQLYSGSNPNKVLACEEFLLVLLGLKAGLDAGAKTKSRYASR